MLDEDVVHVILVDVHEVDGLNFVFLLTIVVFIALYAFEGHLRLTNMVQPHFSREIVEGEDLSMGEHKNRVDDLHVLKNLNYK